MNPSPIHQYYIDLGDGTKREIKFTLGVLRRLKAKLGKSLMNGEAFASLDEEMLPALIHEALVEKNLTEDEISEMIQVPHLERIITEIVTAYSGNFPTAKN